MTNLPPGLSNTGSSKNINKDLLFDDILENLSSLLVPSEQTILSDMVDTYNNRKPAAINKHAPVTKNQEGENITSTTMCSQTRSKMRFKSDV